MKKLTFLFLGFIVTLCLAANVTAMPVIWDLDGVGITGSNVVDLNNQTSAFDEVLIYAETTVTQFDSDFNGVLNPGDYFTDAGTLFGTGFQPGTVDSEGMNLNWQFTGVLNNFAGTVTSVNFNPLTNDTEIQYAYTSGTLDFYANQATTRNHQTRLPGDDLGFADGTLVASFDLVYGVGNTFIDFLGGDVANRGLAEFELQASFLVQDFWFNEDGDDLAELYGSEYPVSWFIQFIDINVDDPILNLAGSPTYPVLFTSSVQHDGSIEFNAVPEPTTMLLLGMGLMGIAALGRKKIFKD